MSDNPEESITENSSNPEFSMPEIPEEAIKEIIFLLPVKSLLKFRCVSPSWLSFIDTPYFLRTHLSKSIPKVILHTPHSCFALDINPVNPKPRAEASVLKLPYSHSSNFIFGSCNGVLLSHHNDKKSDVLLPFDNRKDIVLQNPSTRTFHKVPLVDTIWTGPKDFVSAPEKFVFGLGYDAVTDDYKVFRNCQYYGKSDGEPFYSHVVVYSLKMKSHKQIEAFPYYIQGPMDESVFVGGALHWVVSTARWDKSQWIASFDVSTEEYRLVEQPKYSSGDFKLHLHVLGGCLTVVCNCFPSEHREVWVMKEYGNVESWSKILTLTAVDIGVESISYLKPLFYSECGKKLLIERDGKTLLWYDLEKKSAEFVQLDNTHVPRDFQSFVHLESLVKLSSCVHGPRDE